MRRDTNGFTGVYQEYSLSGRLIGPDKVSLDGVACIGGIFQNAVAAQHSLIQIKNPAGSGVVVAVDSILASVTTAIILGVYEEDADLTTLATDRRQKLHGGGLSIAEIRYESNANLPVTQVRRTYLPQYVNTELIEGPPLILNEGEGYVIGGVTANIGVSAAFNWREI